MSDWTSIGIGVAVVVSVFGFLWTEEAIRRTGKTIRTGLIHLLDPAPKAYRHIELGVKDVGTDPSLPSVTDAGTDAVVPPTAEAEIQTADVGLLVIY